MYGIIFKFRSNGNEEGRLVVSAFPQVKPALKNLV